MTQQTAPMWRARLAEGWCPIDGHGQLGLLAGPEQAGYGYCHNCLVAWRLQEADSGVAEWLAVMIWDGPGLYRRDFIDPAHLDRSPDFASYFLSGVVEKLWGQIGT